VAEIRRTPAAGSAGRGQGMACRSPGLGFRARRVRDHSRRGNSAAAWPTGRWSMRSGEGAAQPVQWAPVPVSVGPRGATGTFARPRELVGGAAQRRRH
jgi:hypothetical protein